MKIKNEIDWIHRRTSGFWCWNVELTICLINLRMRWTLNNHYRYQHKIINNWQLKQNKKSNWKHSNCHQIRTLHKQTVANDLILVRIFYLFFLHLVQCQLRETELEIHNYLKIKSTFDHGLEFWIWILNQKLNEETIYNCWNCVRPKVKLTLKYV